MRVRPFVYLLDNNRAKNAKNYYKKLKAQHKHGDS